MSLNEEPIDAVITWVDGSDPAHAARLAAYLQQIGGPRPSAAHPTRFNDAGELDYCITSMLRFAPWLRTIHIVTDRQVPPVVEKLRGTEYEGKVRVVDHRDIFSGHEQHLPTFNSRAIITALWRIPGLTEEFVFFNDDFVLLQPVAPTDFFRDGKMLVRGRWELQSEHKPWRRLLRWLRRWSDRDPARSVTQRVKNLAAQEESARLAGFERDYLRMYHTPFTQRRSTLQRWFAAHPEKLEHNLGFRLRSPLQFKTEVLAAHLEFAQGAAELDGRLRMVQLKPSEQWFPRLRRKLLQADRDPCVAFACVQSLELAPPMVQRHLIDWLDRRVGRLDALLHGARQA